MSENKEPAVESPPPVEQKSRSGLLKKLIVAAVVGFVIMAECLVTYLVLPSNEQLAAHYNSQGNSQDSQDPSDEAPENEEKLPPMVEIEIGKFSLTRHDPTANTSLRVEFHLVATVLKEDQPKVEQLLATSTHRLRERVIFEIRNAELNDLTDAGLGLIKRRILEKSNELFGKPLFRSVVFSEFSFIEQ